MSKQKRVKSGSSKRLKNTRGQPESDNTDNDQGATQGAEDGTFDFGFVPDGLILPPELISYIFERLNFQTLKQVRLVCKRWLRIAAFQMERRAVVRVHGKFGSTGIKEFSKIIKPLSALPKPFHSVDVDLSETSDSNDRFLFRQFVQQLSKHLCPPLSLSRFTPWDMPLALALPLISQYSSSLECLKLRADSSEAEYLPVMDPQQQFPKLKRLSVYAPKFEVNSHKWLNFPSIVAWIVKATTPYLETYDLSQVRDERLSSRLVVEVDIHNVKELKLAPSPSDRLTLGHHLAIPFRQLQSLDIRFESGHDSESLRISALIVNHSAGSLRKLRMFGFRFKEQPEAPFPTCPNVQELSLNLFIYSSNFLVSRFPSLQTLDVSTVDVKVEGKDWSSLVPFLGVKALRIHMLYELGKRHLGLKVQSPEVFRLFEKFPDLQRLSTGPALLMYCGGLKGGGDPRFSNLLASVKRVDIDCSHRISSSDPTLGSGSWLASLTGIETLSLTSFNQSIATLAVKELPDLKILQFPWGARGSWNFHPDMKALLEVAKGVEKVIVTNGCSLPNAWSRRRCGFEELLKQFFKSASNAVWA